MLVRQEVLKQGPPIPGRSIFENTAYPKSISHRIPEFPNPYANALDGGSQWEYFDQVRAGDRITVTIRLIDLYEREGSLGNMLFVVRENRFVNQANILVAVDRDTEIYYQGLANV